MLGGISVSIAMFFRVDHSNFFHHSNVFRQCSPIQTAPKKVVWSQFSRSKEEVLGKKCSCSGTKQKLLCEYLNSTRPSKILSSFISVFMLQSKCPRANAPFGVEGYNSQAGVQQGHPLARETNRNILEVLQSLRSLTGPSFISPFMLHRGANGHIS